MKYRLRPSIMRVMKLFAVIIVVMSLNNSSLFNSYAFNFNKLDQNVGFVAMVTKEEEEEPKEEVVEVKSTNMANVSSNASYDTENSVSDNTSNLYYGSMTGYSADCAACSGRLACTGYNVYQNGVVTYPDTTYGNVRIVASSSQFPCGSILAVNSSLTAEPMLVIVLDRGVGGNTLDLLVATESEAIRNIGRKSISYSLVRSGW